MLENTAGEAFSDFESRALNQAFGVATYDSDGRIRSANFQFLGLLGYDLDEIVGKDVSIFFSSTLKRNKKTDTWLRFAQGERLQETSLWIGKYGKEVWLESRFLPLANTEGKIESVVQIAENVTTRLQVEAERQAQIEAVEATQAVVHFSLTGTVLRANDLFLASVGYTREEVIGQHHTMFVDPAQHDSADYKAFWSTLASGQHHVGEYRRIAKNGSDVWLQAVYSPIFDPAGRPLKIVKYAVDVTEQKARQSTYEWQIAAIHKSNAVITFDMHGTILDANDLFLEGTGYSIDDIRGRHHRMFVEPSYAHSSDYATFWNDLRAGKHRVGQYRRFGSGGKELWVQATYNPIFDASGRPIKVVKYASVITQEKLLQADYQGQIAAIHKAQCVICFAPDGTILDANDNFLEATGYLYADVRGQHHSMFVEPDHAASREYRTFWADLASGKHIGGEFKRIAKGGREVWLQATYNPIQDMNGRVFKIAKYATDITAEKARQADYRSQVEAINKSQAVAVFSLNGAILDVNQNFEAIVGYEREELIGQHHSVLVEREAVAGREYASFWDTLKSGVHHSGLYRRIGKDGRQVWVQASYNPILDLNGKPSKVVKYATDVSSNVALAQAFDEAKRQAHHDSATSLPNRTKLSAFMSSWLADPAGTMVVFYIDLDRFKPINDNYGHHVGDRVLGEVADRLRRVLREDQMVARVGGDEFVIAAPGMPVEVIERFCRKLYQQMAAPIRHDAGDIFVGMSIGIAIAPSDGSTPDELLRCADAALYRSKESGRGTYTYYSSELNQKINGQRQLVQEMRHSLVAGHFFLEFQPRIDTRHRHIRSAEALLRWAHPERGRINPAEFIPLAEQSGLIVPLGDWVLRTACQTAVQWNGIGVSVNVSPIQFRDPSLVEKVQRVLKETRLQPELLELELTEGVLLDDADRAIEILTSLKELGVKLAMDDFGTGYSSLSYLRNFPFDVIKVDRSFVKDLATQQQSARPIIQAILGLSRALGLSVTAEGVETSEQLLLLATDMCDEVQGFLISKPLDAEGFSRLVGDGSSHRLIRNHDPHAA